MSPTKTDGGCPGQGPAVEKKFATAKQLSLLPVEATGSPSTPASDEPVDVDPFWREHAMREVVELAKTGREFVCYDLVRLRGVSEPANPNAWGPLMAAAREAGLIIAVGAAPSPRRSVAKSLVRVWRGVESGAA